MKITSGCLEAEVPRFLEGGPPGSRSEAGAPPTVLLERILPTVRLLKCCIAYEEVQDLQSSDFLRACLILYIQLQLCSLHTGFPQL